MQSKAIVGHAQYLAKVYRSKGNKYGVSNCPLCRIDITELCNRQKPESIKYMYFVSILQIKIQCHLFTKKFVFYCVIQSDLK